MNWNRFSGLRNRSHEQKTRLEKSLADIYKNNSNVKLNEFLEKLKLPETRHKKVPYGSNLLAKIAQNFRKNWENRLQFNICEQDCYDDIQKLLDTANYSPKPNTAFNLAVAEYIDLNGQTKYFLFASLHENAIPPNGKHSEKRILEFLEANKIPFENFIHCYSEIQPCDEPNHTCREKLFIQTPNTKISYTFDYAKRAEQKFFVNKKHYL